jgi:DNA-binding transcriptional MerR regulator
MMAPDVLRQAGITYRQLDHWSRIGYLKPSNPDCGSGRRRDFPMAEVTVARRMALLVNAGLTLKTAHRVARGDEDVYAKVVLALEQVVA